jgi:hypothetical protein
MSLPNYLQNELCHPQTKATAPSCPLPSSLDLQQELEKLALILVRTWQDEHPDANFGSDEAFQSCTAYVTEEMAKAGAAVGGVAGLTILMGSGSAAARSAYRQMFG